MLSAVSLSGMKSPVYTQGASIRLGSNTSKIPLKALWAVIVEDEKTAQDNFRSALQQAGVPKRRIISVPDVETLERYLAKKPRNKAKAGAQYPFANLNNVILLLDENLGNNKKPGHQIALDLVNPNGKYKMPGQNIFYTTSNVTLPEALTRYLDSQKIPHVHLQKPTGARPYHIQTALVNRVDGVKVVAVPPSTEASVSSVKIPKSPVVVVLNRSEHVSGRANEGGPETHGFSHFQHFMPGVEKQEPYVVFWHFDNSEFNLANLREAAGKFKKTVFVFTNPSEYDIPEEVNDDKILKGRTLHVPVERPFPFYKGLLQGDATTGKIGEFVKAMHTANAPAERLVAVQKFLGQNP